MQVKQVRTEVLNEKIRLENSPKPTDKPTGLGTVRFVVICKSDACELLENAKEVLKIVDNTYDKNWPTLDEWKCILPKKFIDSFDPEMSHQEKIELVEFQKTLSWQEKTDQDKERKWSLSSWLYWMEPENRTWFWWDSACFEEPIKDTHFVIAVTILEWPFPWGALRWLFKAFGAIDVVPEDEV
ncbi:hypothetical protein [Breznakiella homolactica]|uniref:Uncharacterized protein n=1 Tax=Breznakiella homolactica TaxID=2798577 RepID=A0A7T7XMD0_9SPIR|nr:hypothetical protein [Breznakiella homolactica]QQO08995.1 hypothetical protein JFL75_19005 [Breznakiella homolactica]